MKQYPIQVALALFVATMFSENIIAQRINFEPADSTNWSHVMERSKMLNRLIFVEVYSDNSAVCKMMDKRSLNDAELVDRLNVAYVNVRLNIDSPQGSEFAKKYQINCTPAFLFLDWDGNSVIQRGAGFYTAHDLKAMSESVATPDVNTFVAIERDFNGSNPTATIALKYLKALSESCRPTNDVAVKFLTSKKDTDNLLPQHWQIIKEFVTDIESAPFKYLVSKRNAFVSKYGVEEVDGKIFDAYLNRGKEIIYKDKADKNKVGAYKTMVTAVVFDRNKELGLTLDWAYADATGNWKNYYTISKDLLKKYHENDAEFLNTISRKLLDNYFSAKRLPELLEWAKKSTDLKPGWENQDTYARILAKNGDKNQALVVENKAIDLARANEVDTIPLVKTRDSFITTK